MRRRNRWQLSTRGARVGLVVALTAAFVALFGALSASPASAFTWTSWTLGMRVDNRSDFWFTLDRFEGEHIDRGGYGKNREIAPSHEGPVDVAYWYDDTPGVGTRGTAYYDIFDGANPTTSKLVGHFAYTVRVDCDAVLGVCVDVKRSTDGRSWPSPPVRLDWTDNGGLPPFDPYIGTVTVKPVGAPGASPQSCALGGLGDRFANLRVRGIDCGRAKGVIHRGGVNKDRKWRVSRWRCSQERGDGRLHVKCKRGDKRISFDID